MRIRAAINVSALIVPVVHPHLLRPVLSVSGRAGSLCLSVRPSVWPAASFLLRAGRAVTIRAGDAYRRERGSSTSFTRRRFARRASASRREQLLRNGVGPFRRDDESLSSPCHAADKSARIEYRSMRGINAEAVPWLVAEEYNEWARIWVSFVNHIVP
jgi:hypothetical protein